MVVLHQPASLQKYPPPAIMFGHTELKSVQLNYLGSMISHDGRTNKEVDNRLAKASSTFGRLYKYVWNNRSLNRVSNVKVYKAVELTTLLYGAKLRVTYHHHLQLLKDFHLHCQCTIRKICLSDFATNTQVLDIVEVTIIEARLLKIGCIGLDMSQRRKTTAYQRPCCMVNCPQSIAKEV